MACRGVRGATTVEEDSREAIIEATRELLERLTTANGIAAADIVSVIFSATPDLTAAYPAEAARQIGWTETALLCVQEMAVPSSLKRCIRVLVHWETIKAQAEIAHCYLHGAQVLRPDLAKPATGSAVGAQGEGPGE